MNIVENGVYVASQGNNGAYIAMDEYSISQISSGFQIDSNNTIFGINGFQQKAKLRTDAHWNMQELHIIVESLKIEMNAHVNEGKLYIRQKQQDSNFEEILDLQQDKFFFMYNGALVIPMIWLRGFDFDNYEKVTYQMLPTGFAEIKQLANTASDSNICTFSLLLFVQNFTDIVKIQTDIAGKLLSLHSETSGLTIKIK